MGNNFKASQIICIEKGQNLLYAQIIQVISERQTCWLRPLMLVEIINDEDKKIIDLRETSDLILPQSLLRFALDTEVISLLMELEIIEKKEENSVIAKQNLNSFIRKVFRVN